MKHIPKIGDYLVCVSNDGFGHGFTIHKTYAIVDINYTEDKLLDTLVLIDDNNQKMAYFLHMNTYRFNNYGGWAFYYGNFFISLQEFRNLKLRSIMKKTILLFVLAFLTLGSFSQTTEEDSLRNAMEQSKKAYKEAQKKNKKGEEYNLFSKRGKETNVSFLVSFDLGYQKLTDSLGLSFKNDNQTVIAGLTVAAVFNKHFGIGVWGNTNTDNLERLDETAPETNETLYMRYGSGGLIMMARFFPKIPIHFTVPIKAGFGNISYWTNNWALYGITFDKSADSYFIFESGLNLELNIVKFFKIAGGVSYRWTDKIDLYKSPDYILNGWNANLSLIIVYP